MNEQEANAVLDEISRLQQETVSLKKHYSAKVAERNRLIGILELVEEDDSPNMAAPFSTAEVSRRLGLTFMAVKKIAIKERDRVKPDQLTPLPEPGNAVVETNEPLKGPGKGPTVTHSSSRSDEL